MLIEHTAAIDAPPATVWALTTDIERWPALMPTVTRVERLDDGPLAVGSRARLEQPGQRPTVWTVERIDPPTDARAGDFEWSARSLGMRMTARHHVDRHEHGTTNHLAVELGGAGARLLGPLLRRRIARVLATENASFAAAAAG